jgi:hypothetical protein
MCVCQCVYNLALQKGVKDEVYFGTSVSAIGPLFAPWLADEQSQVFYEGTIGSTHAWPTLGFGSPCGIEDKNFPPAIQDCNYDGSGKMLQFIYNNSLSRPMSSNPQGSAKLIAFDQELYGGKAFDGLASTGFVYIPDACKKGNRCRLHIALHGCTMMQLNPAMNLNFTLNLNLNAWADANNLVVLYPQNGGYFEYKNVTTTSFQQATGCWDSYGQTGPLYATKKGLQMSAIARMCDALGW